MTSPRSHPILFAAALLGGTFLVRAVRHRHIDAIDARGLLVGPVTPPGTGPEA